MIKLIKITVRNKRNKMSETIKEAIVVTLVVIGFIILA